MPISSIGEAFHVVDTPTTARSIYYENGIHHQQIWDQTVAPIDCIAPVQSVGAGLTAFFEAHGLSPRINNIATVPPIRVARDNGGGVYAEATRVTGAPAAGQISERWMLTPGGSDPELTVVTGEAAPTNFMFATPGITLSLFDIS